MDEKGKFALAGLEQVVDTLSDMHTLLDELARVTALREKDRDLVRGLKAKVEFADGRCAEVRARISQALE